MFQSNAEELRQAVLRATQRAIASNIVRHNQVTGDKSVFKLSLELHIACSRRALPLPAPALPAAPEVGEHHFTLLWALFYFIRWKLCRRQTPESGEQEKLRSIEVIQCKRCFFENARLLLVRPMSRQYSSNTNSSTSSSFILDYGNSFSEKGSFDVRWIKMISQEYFVIFID